METLDAYSYCEIFKYLPLSTLVPVVERGFAKGDGENFKDCVRRSIRKATFEFKGGNCVESGRKILPRQFSALEYFSLLTQITIVTTRSSVNIMKMMNDICAKCKSIESIELICDKIIKFENLDKLSNVFVGKIEIIALPSLNARLDEDKITSLGKMLRRLVKIKHISAAGWMGHTIIKILSKEDFHLDHLSYVDIGRIRNLHSSRCFITFCKLYGNQLERIKYIPDHRSSPINFFDKMFRPLSKLKCLNMHNESVAYRNSSIAVFEIIARKCQILEELSVWRTRLCKESISDYIEAVSSCSNLRKIRLNFYPGRRCEKISISSLKRCSKLVVFELTLMRSTKVAYLDLSQLSQFCPRLAKLFTANLTIYANKIENFTALEEVNFKFMNESSSYANDNKMWLSSLIRSSPRLKMISVENIADQDSDLIASLISQADRQKEYIVVKLSGLGKRRCPFDICIQKRQNLRILARAGPMRANL
jgi:hypothetical protein